MKASFMINTIDMQEFPQQELAFIFRQGALLRLPHLESRMFYADEQVKYFEKKYATTLTKLKTQGLPDNANYEMHEDLIEWEYWNDVWCKTRVTVGKIFRTYVGVQWL